jgi:hypothetical protein
MTGVRKEMQSTVSQGPGGLVRVLNSSWLGRMFEGSDSAESKRLAEARPGTPQTVAELGGLVEIALDADRVKRKALRALNVRVKTDDHGDKAWTFNPKQSRLVADANGDLHLVGFYLKPPDEFQPGRSQLIGSVVAVTYRPNGETEGREHEFCEHGGDCPKLYFKDGYLLFRGGTYSVTPQGLLG